MERSLGGLLSACGFILLLNLSLDHRNIVSLHTFIRSGKIGANNIGGVTIGACNSRVPGGNVWTSSAFLASSRAVIA